MERSFSVLAQRGVTFPRLHSGNDDELWKRDGRDSEDGPGGTFGCEPRNLTQSPIRVGGCWNIPVKNKGKLFRVHLTIFIFLKHHS